MFSWDHYFVPTPKPKFDYASKNEYNGVCGCDTPVEPVSPRIPTAKFWDGLEGLLASIEKMRNTLTPSQSAYIEEMLTLSLEAEAANLKKTAERYGRNADRAYRMNRDQWLDVVRKMEIDLEAGD